MRRLCLLSALLLGCSEGALKYVPEITVYQRTESGVREVTNGGTVEFSGKAEDRTFEIRNLGDVTLQVYGIRLEGDNPDFSIDVGTTSFPYGLEPARGAIIERLEFKVRYAPSGNMNSVELIIESNDPDTAVFRAKVVPKRAAPRIAVSCGYGPIKFQSSLGIPSVQTITVTNEGVDPLVITEPVRFQTEDDEFDIVSPLDVGKPIYPKGSGLQPEEASFVVRYIPKDIEVDENTILISSNDPVEPVYSIKVEGKAVESADIIVSHPDQQTGCVDFSQVKEQGQVCTKVVTISLSGSGQVTLKRPSVEPANGPYSMEWYEAGGSQDPDPLGCGAYHGNPILGQTYVLLPQRPTVEVAVTYTAPGGKGVNGSLKIPYIVGSTSQEREILLCGGMPLGEIDVAPPAFYSLMFFVPEGESRSKTVVIMNKGPGPLKIRKVEVLKNYPTVDPDAFFVLNPPQPDYVMPPFSLLPLTVEFRANFEEPKVAARLAITYLDPLTDTNQEWDVNMEGAKLPEGTELPIADPGSPSDYANAKVGKPLTLDGSKSKGGSYSLPSTPNTGFRWFIIEKPTDSRLFLNVGDSGPTVSVVPDAPGAYKFGLVVYAVGQMQSLFSDEATVTVQVQP